MRNLSELLFLCILAFIQPFSCQPSTSRIRMPLGLSDVKLPRLSELIRFSGPRSPVQAQKQGKRSRSQVKPRDYRIQANLLKALDVNSIANRGPRPVFPASVSPVAQVNLPFHDYTPPFFDRTPDRRQRPKYIHSFKRRQSDAFSNFAIRGNLDRIGQPTRKGLKSATASASNAVAETTGKLTLPLSVMHMPYNYIDMPISKILLPFSQLGSPRNLQNLYPTGGGIYERLRLSESDVLANDDQGSGFPSMLPRRKEGKITVPLVDRMEKDKMGDDHSPDRLLDEAFDWHQEVLPSLNHLSEGEELAEFSQPYSVINTPLSFMNMPFAYLNLPLGSVMLPFLDVNTPLSMVTTPFAELMQSFPVGRQANFPKLKNLVKPLHNGHNLGLISDENVNGVIDTLSHHSFDKTNGMNKKLNEKQMFLFGTKSENGSTTRSSENDYWKNITENILKPTLRTAETPILDLDGFFALPDAVVNTPFSLMKLPFGFLDNPFGYLNLPLSHFKLPFSHTNLPLTTPLDSFQDLRLPLERTPAETNVNDLPPSMLEALNPDNPLNSYLNLPLSEMNFPFAVTDLPLEFIDLPFAHLNLPFYQIQQPFTHLHLPFEHSSYPFSTLLATHSHETH